MNKLEVLLHTGLYEAVQERFKDWSCEINTHKCGDCVNVHLMLKSDKLLVSVGKYQSNCSNPFTKKRENLGLFGCEIEAHQAWLKRKLELAHLLAAEQTDSRVAKALIERYTNYKTK